MTTSSLAAIVAPTGISAPTYNQLRSSVVTQVQGIFGTDIQLDSSTQEGQFISIFCAGMNDSNASVINAYKSFSPSYASGAAQSSLVKINGIQRAVATNSTVDVIVVGVAGTVINNGVVQDTAGNNWDLPASVLIPTTGYTTVLATAQQVGAISAPINSVNLIATPILGWQAVYNPVPGTLGNPIETDAQLRQRQTISTSFPALTVVGSIEAAVANIPGVINSVLYENNTGVTDSNGIPGHSIAVITYGGDPVAIATAIGTKKAPGCGTYGTTSETVEIGNVPTNINFFQATPEVITATINIHPLTGYTAAHGLDAQKSLYNYINSLNIGDQVYITSAQAVCVSFNVSLMNGSLPTNDYHLVSVDLGINGSPQVNDDIAIPFNGIATIQLSDIVINLV